MALFDDERLTRVTRKPSPGHPWRNVIGLIDVRDLRARNRRHPSRPARPGGRVARVLRASFPGGPRTAPQPLQRRPLRSRPNEGVHDGAISC